MQLCTFASKSLPICRPASIRHSNSTSISHQRSYGTDRMVVFDRAVSKLQQKNRAALHPDSQDFDYLKDEINNRLLDRLEDVYSHQFTNVLEMGSGPGTSTLKFMNEREDVQLLVQQDTSFPMLSRDVELIPKDSRLKPFRVVGDEENLPFAPNSFDVITSNLALHWVNDLPGTLKTCRRLLKDDRLFIASMFGEGTLQELRNCLILAENERHGGISPHISPYAAISDMGNLLGKAGFALTTTDQESITVRYKDAFVLMRDLQLMGESNAIIQRRGAIRRDTLFAAASIYQQMYGDPKDNSIPATFNVIYLCGWTPHSSQPKPKRRGSATHSFADIEKVTQTQPSNNSGCSKLSRGQDGNL